MAEDEKVLQELDGKPDKVKSRYNNRYKKSKKKSGERTRKHKSHYEKKFEGRCEDLKGHIFDCSDAKHTDLFSTTLKEITDYVGRECKYGGDTRQAIENRTAKVPVKFDPPKEPDRVNATDPTSRFKSTTEGKIWEKEIDEHVKRKIIYKENLRTLYSLVWGQCTDYMRAKLESLSNYEKLKTDCDSLGLLSAIQEVTFKFDGQKNFYHALHVAKRKLYVFRQGADMTNAKYLEKFKDLVSMIEQNGGDIGIDSKAVTKELTDMGVTLTHATAAQDLKARQLAYEKYLAVAFLLGSDRRRYGKLIDELQNDFTKNSNTYPKTVTEAYNLLINYKNTNWNFSKETGEGLQFTQAGKGGKPKDKSKVKCYNCGEYGHYAPECPKKNNKKGTMNVQVDESDAESASSSSDSESAGVSDSERDYAEGYDSDGYNLNAFAFCTVTHRHRVTFMQDEKYTGLSKWWILLDNQSTCNVFCNKALLKNIRKVNRSLTIYTNGGKSVTNLKGDLEGVGTVWFDPEGMANVLSLAWMKRRYRVTYDSWDTESEGFVVHKPEKQVLFKETPSGLFVHDVRNRQVVMVNTVAENEEGYTQRQVLKAKLARKVYAMVGRPSVRDFINMVKLGAIKNCPVTADDIVAAEKIFGPDIGALKGKTTRETSPQVQTDIVAVPKKILALHKNITLAADLMFINKLPFFISISRKLQFTTSESTPNKTAETLFKSVKKIKDIYNERGFNLKVALMDPEFECLTEKLRQIGVRLNIASMGEHVPEAERRIRVLKERIRAERCTLPFKYLPKVMLKALVAFCVFWINFFPAMGGVSKTVSPRTIITEVPPDFTTHCRIPFGAYAQVYENPTYTNDTEEPRTVGAIALGPSGNLQGGYKFMSLNTGQVLDRTSFKELPMPADVIKCVNDLGLKDKQKAELTFADRNGNILPEIAGVDDDDDAVDSDYEPETDSDTDDDTSDNYDDSDDDISESSTESSGAEDDSEDNGDDDDDNGDNGDDRSETTHKDTTEDSSNINDITDNIVVEDTQDTVEEVDDKNDDTVPVETENDNTVAVETVEDDDGVEPPVEEQVDTTDTQQQNDTVEDRGARISPRPSKPKQKLKTGKQRKRTNKHKRRANEDWDTSGIEVEHGEIEDEEVYHPESMTPSVQQTHGMKLRPRKPRDYSHTFVTLMHYAMTQYGVKAGLKKFKEKGEEAVVKEFTQLHMRDTFEPRHAKDLTEEEKEQALRSLMFLKEKRDASIKARTCADGRKQREIHSKEECASPTVALESVFLTAVVDALERRDVATADIPGAYLNSDMDEVVHMVLEGRLAELMVATAPEVYRKYVSVGKNGKKVLYVKLRKALYGCLRSALLFWRLLSNDLIEQGFELNPYDPCVANKMVNGKQFTICWHVDDLKLSHVDPNVVTKELKRLEKKYGELKIKRGPKHEYLGIDFDFGVEGEVKISMIPYVKSIISDFMEEITGSAATPAADHLFQVNEEAEKLSEEMSVAFHNATAKLLFLCKRARPDIQTAVAFLTTRVKGPDVDDWKKLVRCLKYLNGTLELPLILRADGTSILKWWVDGSYAVHKDMRSHTGGCMSMGEGMVYCTSQKQRLNTKSSTETELVGANDVMPQLLWTQYFLNAQGYGVKDSYLYQDNQSAILLEKNGKASSGKRTRHINIRFFFIKDRIDKKELSVHYCPTDDMVADFFTKPLQGKKFFQFRKLILNLKD